MLLREATLNPTPCRELVMGEPDFIGIKDASIHGVGGVIIGHIRKCKPTVFRMEWPPDIEQAVLWTNSKQGGHLTNSDLEMAGLLMLWLVMEDVCPTTNRAHIALFSDNSPTVHWVKRLTAKHSAIAMQLVRALALCLHLKRASPLMPLHIAGVDNGCLAQKRNGTATLITTFSLCSTPLSHSQIRHPGQNSTLPPRSVRD